jgi:hypothetical protein
MIRVGVVGGDVIDVPYDKATIKELMIKIGSLDFKPFLNGVSCDIRDIAMNGDVVTLFPQKMGIISKYFR